MKKEKLLKILKELPRITVRGCWYIELGSVVSNIDKLLKERNKEFENIIKDMPEVFPELENDDYDKAYQDAKSYMLNKLKELK